MRTSQHDSPGKGAAAPGGCLGPTASHNSACSSRAADGQERWHIPVTDDGSSSYLISDWVQREEEEPEKIENALRNISGDKPHQGTRVHTDEYADTSCEVFLQNFTDQDFTWTMFSGEIFVLFVPSLLCI